MPTSSAYDSLSFIHYCALLQEFLALLVYGNWSLLYLYLLSLAQQDVAELQQEFSSLEVNVLVS